MSSSIELKNITLPEGVGIFTGVTNDILRERIKELGLSYSEETMLRITGDVSSDEYKLTPYQIYYLDGIPMLEIKEWEP